MSDESRRWLEGVTGRQAEGDRESAEGAAVGAYFRRRSAEEAGETSDDEARQRMLRYLRERGAFAAAPAAPAGPAGWRWLREWLFSPLRPQWQYGLAGAVTVGLAAILVLQDPGAGGRRGSLQGAASGSAPATAPAAPAPVATPAPAASGVAPAAPPATAVSAPVRATRPAPAPVPAATVAPSPLAVRAGAPAAAQPRVPVPPPAPTAAPPPAPAAAPAPALAPAPVPASPPAPAPPPAPAAAAAPAAAVAESASLAAPQTPAAPIARMAPASAPALAQSDALALQRPPVPVAQNLMPRVASDAPSAKAATAPPSRVVTARRVLSLPVDRSRLALDALFDADSDVLREPGRALLRQQIGGWLAQGDGSGQQVTLRLLRMPGGTPDEVGVANLDQRRLSAVAAFLAEEWPRLAVSAMPAPAGRDSPRAAGAGTLEMELGQQALPAVQP